MIWKQGATRKVLLIGKYAIKFPNWSHYRNFLQGILANQQEWAWNGYHDLLCPVYFHFPFSLFIIMPRCEPVRGRRRLTNVFRMVKGDLKDLVELKPSSFGLLNSHVVAVDYGS